MNLLKQLSAIALLAGAIGSAQATPVAGSSLQNIINNLYTAGGTSTALAPDVNANQYQPDQVWALDASGAAIATFIIEIAGNANSNTMGVYNAADPTKFVTLFTGSMGSGDKVALSINADGSGGVVNLTTFSGQGFAAGTLNAQGFGFFLGNAGGPIFYSEQSRNGGADQMVAFEGDGDQIKLPGQSAGSWAPNEFILAWEDIAYGSSDKDFDDLVVMVESVHGVSEPGTLALMGLSLAGLGMVARRRRS